MEKEKNYVGKVVDVHYLAYDIKPLSKIGIVLEQSRTENDRMRLRMLLTDGTLWNHANLNVIQISPARIDRKLRSSLKQFYKAHVKQAACGPDTSGKEKYQKQQGAAWKSVRDFTGPMEYEEFSNSVEKLFKETFPEEESSSRYWHNKYFFCRGGTPLWVQVDHIQEVEKWPNPDKFPFLYHIHDNTLDVDMDHPQFEQFCEQNLPSVIPALKGKCKTSGSVYVNDNHILTAKRTYTFPLSNGFSRKSLEELSLLIRLPEKTSLAARINSIAERSVSAEQMLRNKNNVQSHEY